ncbi:MAG TPA: YeaH/YhbH family protein [Rhodocyclaceae bacterium]|nr:YeaH/YhbH family protein [Rhodocyclaceae bacterium]
MTEVRIVDRRYDTRNKSTVNRSRFLRRFKSQIRAAVKEAIGRRGISDIDQGEKIGIPAGDISEPQFRHGRGGVRQDVLAGNDRYHAGDQLERPSEAGGKSGAGGGADDHFAFSLSREEFLDIFFEDLALPNLVKIQLARIDEFKRVRAGFTSTGVPTNINIVRSMRGAAGRRIAVGAPQRKALRLLQEELGQLESCGEGDSPRARELRRDIARRQRKLEQVRFIDTFDLRFNNRIRIPAPSTRAVMFCLMDVSGSMDEEKKQAAKRFFMLLYLFLTRTYKHIEIVFIRHHTQALEVDEEEFFHSRESGGTVVSSALELMHQIIVERYATSTWNIYGAQASDGENWDADSPRCRELLVATLLPMLQYYAYIEISAAKPQSLWLEYQWVRETHPARFAMQRIAGLPDIYPVFRELFRKQPA